MTIDLVAGQVYTILIQDVDRVNFGDGQLRISAPYGYSIQTGGNGRGSQAIELPCGDGLDNAYPAYFELTAPAKAKGGMTVTLQPGQAVQVAFQLYDSDGNAIGGVCSSPADGQPATYTYTGVTPGGNYHLWSVAFAESPPPGPANVTADVDFELFPPLVQSESLNEAQFAYYNRAVTEVACVFDANVAADLMPAALVLFNQVTGTSVDPANMAVWFDPDTNTARWTFPGFAQGALPYGIYSVSLSAAGLVDPAGNQLDGNGDGVAGDDFSGPSFLVGIPGDTNLDGSINGDDFVKLAVNYTGTDGTGKNWLQGDFDGDGDVDGDDFVALAVNYTGSPTGAQTSSSSAPSMAAETAADSPAASQSSSTATVGSSPRAARGAAPVMLAETAEEPAPAPRPSSRPK